MSNLIPFASPIAEAQNRLHSREESKVNLFEWASDSDLFITFYELNFIFFSINSIIKEYFSLIDWLISFLM